MIIKISVDAVCGRSAAGNRCYICGSTRLGVLQFVLSMICFVEGLMKWNTCNRWVKVAVHVAVICMKSVLNGAILTCKNRYF